MLLSRLRARLAASAARVSRPRALGAVAGTGVATAAAVYNSAVFASDGVLAPTPMPWDFDGYLTTYDAAAVRRGHQVYSQVCASCPGPRPANPAEGPQLHRDFFLVGRPAAVGRPLTTH